jgi:hypothetical protein
MCVITSAVVATTVWCLPIDQQSFGYWSHLVGDAFIMVLGLFAACSNLSVKMHKHLTACTSASLHALGEPLIFG